MCDSKKLRFIKNQKASRLLSSLRIRTHKIVNKFLSAGDKFTPEINVRQQGFMYRPCRSITKNKEEIQKFEK